uniref:Uncharacterized protein n=1 Tax=Pipistrellus kuhlii TaxID=59472 RepID=A0A7J7YXB9_PIPKU|nr:hypothetical protein mPipKuh1_009883 [Pipistrellus kuhlii]
MKICAIGLPSAGCQHQFSSGTWNPGLCSGHDLLSSLWLEPSVFTQARAFSLLCSSQSATPVDPFCLALPLIAIIPLCLPRHACIYKLICHLCWVNLHAHSRLAGGCCRCMVNLHISLLLV